MASPSKLAAHFLQFRIQYSSIAFLYYDYALTFPDEVKYMWSKKFRFTTLLYICCRYALAANVLYALAQMGKLGARLHSPEGRTQSITAEKLYLSYSRLLELHALFLILCMFQDLGVKDLLEAKSATLLSILMVVFESFAAILLIIQSMRMFRIGGTWRFDSESTFTIVFKQGVIYFTVVSIFTMAAVILNFKAPSGTFLQRLPNAYTLPLSCTLIARFLLQLRQRQERTVVIRGDEGQVLTAQDQNTQTLTEMRANTVIDSIIVSDFGDGPSSATRGSRGGWDTETRQDTHGGAKEKSRADSSHEAVTLHEIHVDNGDDESRKQVKV